VGFAPPVGPLGHVCRSALPDGKLPPLKGGLEAAPTLVEKGVRSAALLPKGNAAPTLVEVCAAAPKGLTYLQLLPTAATNLAFAYGASPSGTQATCLAFAYGAGKLLAKQLEAVGPCGRLRT
jgi:hypothetical protein